MIYKNKCYRHNANSIILLHLKGHQSFEISDTLRQQLNVEGVETKILHDIVQTLFHFDVLLSTDVPF